MQGPHSPCLTPPLSVVKTCKSCGCAACICSLLMVHLQVSTVDGTTPLHAAASSGQSDVVRVLLGVGADASAKNKVRRLQLWSRVYQSGTNSNLLYLAPGCRSLCADGICRPS